MGVLKKVRERTKRGSFRDMWRGWKWIYGYTKRYRGSVAGYLVLSLAGIGMGLLGGIASKNLIDMVTGFQKTRIFEAAVVMAGTAFAGMVIHAACSRLSAWITLKIQNDMQREVFQKLAETEWIHLSAYHSGDMLNRFGKDIKTAASSAMGWLVQLITGSVSFAASLCLILYYDSGMAMIALVNAPVMVFFSRIFLGRLGNYNRQLKVTDSEMTAFQEETFCNLDAIKAFGITELFNEKLKTKQGHWLNVNLKYNQFSIITNMALSVLGMCIEYSCFGWGIYRLWTGKITFGEMTLFLSQSDRISGNFHGLAALVPTAIGAAVSAGRIMELTDLPKEKVQLQEREFMEDHREEVCSISLRKVSFGYTKENQILREASLEIHPGEITAFVGPSGEGKTTLIRILLGLLFPESGKVLLVDRAGNQIPAGAATRGWCGYVPQGNTLFSGTIAENMRMIRENAGDKEIVEALKIACIYEFTEKLPQGIYSRIGEKGQGISEGQAQRFAIARAVLRESPVLLLDEATSALDSDTERRVLQNLVRTQPGRICILVTHKRNILSICQKVYQVREGKIARVES